MASPAMGRGPNRPVRRSSVIRQGYGRDASARSIHLRGIGRGCARMGTARARDVEVGAGGQSSHADHGHRPPRSHRLLHYVRDPDQNLIELAFYDTARGCGAD